MNALVSYASDSDSDSDSNKPYPSSSSTATATIASHSTQPKITQQSSKPSTPKLQALDHQEDQKGNNNDNKDSGDNDEDDFVSAALKDLQSFAASVDPTPQEQIDTPSPKSQPSTVNSPSIPTKTSLKELEPTAESNTMDIDETEDQIMKSLPSSPSPPLAPPSVELTSEQQIIFDAFLREIDAIPLTSVDQTYPPGYSPASQPPTSKPSIEDDADWVQMQTPQALYSRIHRLSILPKTEKFNPKDVENRLVEFAIRLLDWEQGGLKPSYFLGEERAKAVINKEVKRKENSRQKRGISRASQHDSDHDSSSSDEDQDLSDEEMDKNTDSHLPPYSGVVGEMIEFMHSMEQVVVPDHWTIRWSIKDLNYLFHHTATETESEEYPSIELQNRLNPPSSASSSTVTPVLV
ncbi:hypothetical protein FBU30_001129 [Linnemannia zychae]|nr:hypothetical protein FBU30_001129 [Linnemannia zychae]